MPIFMWYVYIEHMQYIRMKKKQALKIQKKYDVNYFYSAVCLAVMSKTWSPTSVHSNNGSHKSILFYILKIKTISSDLTVQSSHSFSDLSTEHLCSLTDPFTVV